MGEREGGGGGAGARHGDGAVERRRGEARSPSAGRRGSSSATRARGRGGRTGGALPLGGLGTPVTPRSGSCCDPLRAVGVSPAAPGPWLPPRLSPPALAPAPAMAALGAPRCRRRLACCPRPGHGGIGKSSGPVPLLASATVLPQPPAASWGHTGAGEHPRVPARRVGAGGGRGGGGDEWPHGVWGLWPGGGSEAGASLCMAWGEAELVPAIPGLPVQWRGTRLGLSPAGKERPPQPPVPPWHLLPPPPPQFPPL